MDTSIHGRCRPPTNRIKLIAICLTMVSTDSGSKWINAFSDPLVGLYTFPTCMALADLSGDGDHKLIIADLGTGKYNMKLKVYKGVTLLAENALVDLPTSVSTFFMDHVQPSAPAIAVASGPSVYIYKNLKPYYKFNLPSMEVNETEKEVWNHVANDELDVKSLTDVLESLKEQLTIANMTSRSQRLLMLPTQEAKQEFINIYKNETLKKQSTITCMTTMKKSAQEAEAIDCLVIGCENGQVLCVDAEAFTPLSECAVPSAPVFLHASGMYDVEYRILACCRNGCVYSIKRDMKTVTKATIELSSHAVGMAKVGKQIIIACMDRTLRCYSLKGRKVHEIKMNATITSIECFWYEPKQYLATLVALDTKEVHLYQETFLVDLLKLDDIATSLKFGKFGREEGALVIGTKSGGLLVKLFKRTAKLEEKSHLPGPPQAQSQKLNVPKKTKIFVDQTMRERYEGQRMHQVFQRDLFMLRLHTAQAYSRIIEHSLTPVSFDPDDMVKISAIVQGFGPTFLMIIYLRTMSVQAVTNLSITFQFNPRLYSLDQMIIPVPMLVPGTEYTFQTKISCLMPDKGLADDVKVLVVRQGKIAPLLTAMVTMPISEQSLID